MTAPCRIAVLGAGSIGRRHAAAVAGGADGAAVLAGLADPDPGAASVAHDLGVPFHSGLDALIESERLDGIVIATPSGLHAEHARTCIDAGIPVLIEKPLAADLASARRIVLHAAEAGVPVLVGHHRRHHPGVAAARAAIDEGRIGRIVCVNAMAWLMKPDAYFEPEWRRAPGAGPILTNLVHDIDLLRHLCGDIVSVQALRSDAIRGHAVEDSAVVALRFASGALGTLSVSDTAVAPWSWELTAAENPDYPATGQACYLISGTRGALEMPTLRLWRNPGPTGWFEPLEASTLGSWDTGSVDLLALQAAHFAQVIAGRAAPRVTAEDGLAAIAAIDAIERAARTGETIEMHHEDDAP